MYLDLGWPEEFFLRKAFGGEETAKKAKVNTAL